MFPPSWSADYSSQGLVKPSLPPVHGYAAFVPDFRSHFSERRPKSLQKNAGHRVFFNVHQFMQMSTQRPFNWRPV
jgi:hypothetical protein